MHVGISAHLGLFDTLSDLCARDVRSWRVEGLLLRVRVQASAELGWLNVFGVIRLLCNANQDRSALTKAMDVDDLQLDAAEW